MRSVGGVRVNLTGKGRFLSILAVFLTLGGACAAAVDEKEFAEVRKIARHRAEYEDGVTRAEHLRRAIQARGDNALNIILEFQLSQSLNLEEAFKVNAAVLERYDQRDYLVVWEHPERYPGRMRLETIIPRMALRAAGYCRHPKRDTAGTRAYAQRALESLMMTYQMRSESWPDLQRPSQPEDGSSPPEWQTYNQRLQIWKLIRKSVEEKKYLSRLEESLVQQAIRYHAIPEGYWQTEEYGGRTLKTIREFPGTPVERIGHAMISAYYKASMPWYTEQLDIREILSHPEQTDATLEAPAEAQPPSTTSEAVSESPSAPPAEDKSRQSHGRRVAACICAAAALAAFLLAVAIFARQVHKTS